MAERGEKRPSVRWADTTSGSDSATRPEPPAGATPQADRESDFAACFLQLHDELEELLGRQHCEIQQLLDVWAKDSLCGLKARPMVEAVGGKAPPAPPNRLHPVPPTQALEFHIPVAASASSMTFAPSCSSSAGCGGGGGGNGFAPCASATFGASPKDDERRLLLHASSMPGSATSRAGGWSPTKAKASVVFESRTDVGRRWGSDGSCNENTLGKKWRHMVSEKRKKKANHGRKITPLARQSVLLLEAKRSPVQQLTRSRFYELLSAALIVLNAVFIVAESWERAASAARDVRVESGIVQNDLFFCIVRTSFCVVFTVDLMLRFLAERTHFFTGPREWGWNVLDAIIVATAIGEVVFYWQEIKQDKVSNLRRLMGTFSFLRIARLLRIITVSRDIRVIRFIREIRIMVYSIITSMKSFIWAMVLLIIWLVMAAVLFTDKTVSYCLENDAWDLPETSELRAYFGTLPDSFLTLYQSVNNGVDWRNAYEALDLIGEHFKLFFVIFVTFTTLALWNVITAVFVDAAMQKSQSDREFLIDQEMQSRGELVDILLQVFEELDRNGNGSLSKDEFERHIQDENIAAYMSSLDLNIDQISALFALLDRDNTGEVDVKEFVTGCLRLKGGAKTLDIAILQYQVEWVVHNLGAMSDMLEERLDAMASFFQENEGPPEQQSAPRPRGTSEYSMGCASSVVEDWAPGLSSPMELTPRLQSQLHPPQQPHGHPQPQLPGVVHGTAGRALPWRRLDDEELV